MAEELCLVALPEDHPRAREPELEFKDLLDEPFLALPESAGPLRDYLARDRPAQRARASDRRDHHQPRRNMRSTPRPPRDLPNRRRQHTITDARWRNHPPRKRRASLPARARLARRRSEPTDARLRRRRDPGRGKRTSLKATCSQEASKPHSIGRKHPVSLPGAHSAARTGTPPLRGIQNSLVSQLHERPSPTTSGDGTVPTSWVLRIPQAFQYPRSSRMFTAQPKPLLWHLAPQSSCHPGGPRTSARSSTR